MLINWLANKVATALQRTEADAVAEALDVIRQENEERAREHRALLHEVEDILEKTQRMFARLAMRRSRELKKTLDQADEGEAEQEQQQQQPDWRTLPASERKKLLRQQLRGGGFRRAEPE